MCNKTYIERTTDEYTYIYTQIQICIYMKHTYIYTHTNIHIDKYIPIYTNNIHTKHDKT